MGDSGVAVRDAVQRLIERLRGMGCRLYQTPTPLQLARVSGDLAIGVEMSSSACPLFDVGQMGLTDDIHCKPEWFSWMSVPDGGKGGDDDVDPKRVEKLISLFMRFSPNKGHALVRSSLTWCLWAIPDLLEHVGPQAHHSPTEVKQRTQLTQVLEACVHSGRWEDGWVTTPAIRKKHFHGILADCALGITTLECEGETVIALTTPPKSAYERERGLAWDDVVETLSERQRSKRAAGSFTIQF